ncbi:hypothetical protein B296_00011519 [Ensete ventricosum]|uniref:Wall-associated receptor kinase galacturonan-binding domain-containing protein n=1 Tax=Ensete ventricosum TaxID=4639 RepID=A0A426ZYB6_ENSVE|nr:hypothetical protein B296_00011519 [Ensete ventricosum]
MLLLQHSRHRLLFFFLFLADLVVDVLSVVSARAAEDCNRTCGSYTAPYPFGFSVGCPIRLECYNPSKSSVRIGEFTVRNITDDSLLVDVPPACNRSIDAVKSLFGHNYALTERNGLFLGNCTPVANKSLSARCAVNTILFDGSCGPRYDNATCFYNATREGFFDEDSVAASGCSFFFTSIGYDDVRGASVPSLDLRTAELAWWLNGTCRCAGNASCAAVRASVTHLPRFRCRCSEGFQGDGFIGGTGCRKGLSLLSICDPFTGLSHGFK